MYGTKKTEEKQSKMYRHYLQTKRVAKTSNGTLLAVFVLIVIVFMAYQGGYLSSLNLNGNGPSTKPGSGTGSQSGSSACSASSGWQVQQKPLAYGSDTLAGTASENAYVTSTGAGAPDLTGTTTFTSAGTYPLNGAIMIQASETSTVTAYPVDYLLQASGTIPSTGTVLSTMGNGLTTAQVLCTPSASNSNAYVWTVITTPIQAPASGTSATTGAIMVCQAANGAAITTATTVLPSTSIAITCTLELEVAYKGAGYNDCIYGTSANPVTNYATGQVFTTPSQGCVNFGMDAYIATNATSTRGTTFTLDPSSPAGLGMQSVPGNTVTSGTSAYVISGFTGCNVAPGSTSTTSYYPCVTFTVDVSQAATTTGHEAIEFGMIDGQQTSYVLGHFGTGAVTSFTAAQGAHAGLTNNGVNTSSFTPTTGNDAGAFGPLVEQFFTSITSQ